MSANENYYCPYCDKEITGTDSFLRHISLRNHKKEIVNKYMEKIHYYVGEPPSHYNKQQKYDYYIKILKNFGMDPKIKIGDKTYEADVHYEMWPGSYKNAKRIYKDYYYIHIGDEEYEDEKAFSLRMADWKSQVKKMLDNDEGEYDEEREMEIAKIINERQGRYQGNEIIDE